MTNKQALDELLPCFGCKSVNISLTHIHGVRWGVQCHDCDLHTDPDAKTKEEATAHWNRYFRWFLVDIPERSMMQDRTEEYDDGYLNGFHDGQKPALTQPNQALVEALKTIANMPESGSNDLEIKIAKEALSAYEAQPAQTVVEVENNIKLLCHECGKTHEHEYNKPPRHGSCEVCGRQSMLCTRVMTEAARLQLERQKGGV